VPGVTPAVLHNLGTTCAKADEKDAVYAVDTYNQSIANTAASIRAAASDVDHIGAVLYRSADYGTTCAIVETFESYGLDRASFNQGANAQYGFSVLTEQQPTLVAKGPGAVCAVQRGEDSNE
jgi:hypothetical protein